MYRAPSHERRSCRLSGSSPGRHGRHYLWLWRRRPLASAASWTRSCTCLSFACWRCGLAKRSTSGRPTRLRLRARPWTRILVHSTSTPSSSERARCTSSTRQVDTSWMCADSAHSSPASPLSWRCHSLPHISRYALACGLQFCFLKGVWFCHIGWLGSTNLQFTLIVWLCVCVSMCGCVRVCVCVVACVCVSSLFSLLFLFPPFGLPNRKKQKQKQKQKNSGRRAHARGELGQRRGGSL